MDVETQIPLADVRLDRVGFTVAELDPPFCVSTNKGPIGYCYLLRKGELWLDVDAPEPVTIALGPGSIVGLSGLLPHRFKSDAGLKNAVESRLITTDFRSRKDSAPIELIVGQVPQEALAFTGLFIGPVVISPDKAQAVARRIWHAIDQIEDELIDPSPMAGTAIVIRRLAEIILLNIVRWVTPSTSEEASGLEALGDMRILRAMAAFWRDPLKDWTVRELADIAGMSRTAFSGRFHALIGLSPLQSVTQLRLHLAATSLARDGQSVEVAAATAGYSSAAAFVRAFQREFRMTPARWRSSQRSSAST